MLGREEGGCTLSSPVEDETDLVGHGERDEVAEADDDEDRGEESQRGALRLEASRGGLEQ